MLKNQAGERERDQPWGNQWEVGRFPAPRWGQEKVRKQLGASCGNVELEIDSDYIIRQEESERPETRCF